MHDVLWKRGLNMSIRGRRVERAVHRGGGEGAFGPDRLLSSCRSHYQDRCARATNEVFAQSATDRSRLFALSSAVLARWMDKDNRGKGRKGRSAKGREEKGGRCDEVVAPLPSPPLHSVDALPYAAVLLLLYRVTNVVGDKLSIQGRSGSYIGPE